VRVALMVLVACGSEAVAPIAPAPAIPAATVAPTAAVPAAKPCPPGAPAGARSGEWRYALVTAQLDPVEDVPLAGLADAWRDGTIAAHPDTITALAPVLGDPARVRRLGRGERVDLARGRAILPAHELSPVYKAIRVAGKHPLVDDGPLVVPLCGGASPTRNIDPERMTTLVMTGTTALTRRTAERIDSHGARDVVSDIAPWFRSADLVHISNEAAFVRDCDPLDGPTWLTFCSRDSYIRVLEELGTDIVELTGSHLIDYGQYSLLRTIAMYERRGWVWFGGGRTQLEATEPRIVEHHGNRLAFLGCNAVGTWLHALSTGAGVAGCDWARMTWQVADLRRRGFLPIVAIQHQETATHDPPPQLVADLRRIAEAGAAFVLGSQAHSAHPWDVHHGAYVHYGPGNMLFHQYPEAQREAAIDKLYVHAGALLAVEHLYIRQEHGRPRLLNAREGARMLRQLGAVAAKMPPSAPWAAPLPISDPRTRPDSLVVAHGRLQHLAVRVPEPFVVTKRYPLVVDLRDTPAPNDEALVVSPRGTLRATGAEIARYVLAKYPADPDRTQILVRESQPLGATKTRPCRKARRSSDASCSISSMRAGPR
jgi:poly-gamma-glutamate synthesis protein (capsule biosynthesis protein)